MQKSIKELRKEIGMTQEQASKYVSVPLRTYKIYENDGRKIGSIKYEYILEKLKELTFIDEEHGILSRDKIETICGKIFEEYDIQYCYLFGSYAKGLAKETSDIDLLVSTSVTGIAFYGLAERLREQLKKKVDLLDLNQLTNNKDLLDEILKDGVKIYG